MSNVSRDKIADYLNISKTTTPNYVLMGTGFNTLNESPNAQMDEKTYISDTSSTSTVKSYKPQFAFDADLKIEQEAIKNIYDIGRNHAIGADAQRDYVRVDLFDPVVPGSTTLFKARRFRVSVEVSSFAGAGGETVVASGNFNAVGDVVLGYFDVTSFEFTEGEYAAALGSLTVTSIAGATTGTTKITVAEPLTSGNVYMYKTASTVTAPVLDADCSSYTLWNGIADITAVTGNQICIVEVNTSYQAKKTGITAVTAKA